jgi:hypothetical protein
MDFYHGNPSMPLEGTIREGWHCAEDWITDNTPETVQLRSLVIGARSRLKEHWQQVEVYVTNTLQPAALVRAILAFLYQKA